MNLAVKGGNIEKRVHFISLLPEVYLPAVTLNEDEIKNRKASYDFPKVKDKLDARYLYQLKITEIEFGVDNYFGQSMSINTTGFFHKETKKIKILKI